MQCYRFYLNDMLFPVTPSKLTCKYSNKNKVVTLINGGELNLLKQPGLTEFSFEAVLPQQKYPFSIYENGVFQEAQYFLYLLKEMKRKNKPVYFKVLRDNFLDVKTFDTYNLKCTLESFSVTEDASQGLDITVALTLKQYQDYFVEKYTLEESGEVTTEQERPTDKEKPSEEAPRSYTVVKGDTLMEICRREYGDGNRCWETAEKNGITNPNLIYPGQVILLD